MPKSVSRARPSAPISTFGRLDIAMDDARGVDVGKRAEQLASERDQVELTGAPSGDPLGERVAAD
jgi:hypothetical protein